MKRIGLQVIILLFIVLSSCKDNPNEFSISGRIEHANEKSIAIKRIYPDRVEFLDSVKVNENGEFEWINEVSYPAFFLLEYGTENQIHLLVYPGDRIAILADASDFYQSYHIEGSPESLSIKNMNYKLNHVISQIDSLGNVYRENIDNPRLDTVKSQLDTAYYAYTESYKNFAINYIKENPASLINLMIFSQQFDERNYVLSTREDFELFKMVDTSLYQLYPESEFVLALHVKINELEQLFKIMENNQKMLETGNVAPEIDLKDYLGNDFLLSSLKGKYVILTFGGSWSRESNSELKYLKDSFENYHAKGLEIVQFSIERNEQTWQNFIQKDTVRWTLISDFKFWDSPVVKIYNITSIPATFILDKKGVIIARNLRGDELTNELKNIFNK